MQDRQPYKGTARKLVLAFDVGTTYSGVSYSILDPGEVPVIYDVQRFPATDHVGGNHKIPSVAYYDTEGVPQAFGSEALSGNVIEKAEEGGWTKAEWWKLHLRPRTMEFSDVKDQDLPRLPPNRTAIQILGDFLGYLFRCAETYIKETHAGGSDMWASFGENIDFVLCHPNGWEGPQQAQIRRAAVLAGLVPDSPKGQARVKMVTEGEASLHFCLSSKKTAGSFKEDQGVMIIDAGGGTIDVSSYYMVTSTSPSTFQEIAPTQCRMQGAVFVTRRAQDFLTVKLAGSKFGTPDDIAHIAREFDKTAKLSFNNANNPSYVPFAGARDRDPDFNIKFGQLKIMGTDVASFFEPSVKAIITAMDNQRKVATKDISSIFLVGGFAANDWLFSKLQEHLKSLKLNFCRPDGHTGKAVSNGAVAFYLDHRVSGRVSKFTYGTSCAVEFNGQDDQHLSRAMFAVSRPSGRMVLPDVFSAILHKGTMVSEVKEFRKEFVTEGAGKTSCNMLTTEITCYRGNASNPRWIDSEPAMFTNLCSIHADTSKVSKTRSPQSGSAGAQFYSQKFSIVLMFGLTELQAQLSWMEDGKEQRGPATVVFDPVVEEI